MRRKPIVVDGHITIRFVGVWDTVDAYGIPIYELKKGIDSYIWPLALEDPELDSLIDKACHAIGIDDKRTTFHPLLWDESGQTHNNEPLPTHTDDERLTQVFFTGVHANIGGGYPDDNLSLVPLNWMMKEAAKAGIEFKDSAIVEIVQNVQPHGRLYDSRAGFASYYRYEPRHFGAPRDNQRACIPQPKIHEGVLVRMAMGTDNYAPLTLPATARVFVEESWDNILAGVRSSQNIFSLDAYSGLSEADGGYPKIGNTTRGSEIIASLMHSDHYLRELAWDTVWWRRVAYFFTLFASIALFISPLYSVLTQFLAVDMVYSAFGLQSIEKALTFIFGSTVELISDGLAAVLPSVSESWIKALKDDPVNFLGLSFLLLVCIVWGKLIDRRINDRSFAAYNTFWRDQRAEWFRISLQWRSITAKWSSVILGSLLCWIAYLTLNREACAENDALCGLYALIDAVSRVIVGGILLFFLIYSMFTIFALRRLPNQPISSESRGLALHFANRLRNSRRLVGLYRWAGSQVVPALFALLIAVNSIGLLNRISFNTFSQIGWVCPSSVKEEDDDFTEKTILLLRVSSVCQPTGLKLVADWKYEIFVVDDMSKDEDTESLNEVQKAAREQVLNLPENAKLPYYGGLLNAAVLPFRRVLKAGFFTLIARVGPNEFVVGTNRTIVAREGGELFLYLNDIVVGVPGFFGALYRQNGTIKVRVQVQED
jgi:hypothetical protein